MSSAQPVLSGHYEIPQCLLLNTGSNVEERNNRLFCIFIIYRNTLIWTPHVQDQTGYNYLNLNCYLY